jgi:hypothetical protein
MHIMVFMMHFLAFTQVKIRVGTNSVVNLADNYSERFAVKVGWAAGIPLSR